MNKLKKKNLYLEMNEIGINRISSRPYKILSDPNGIIWIRYKNSLKSQYISASSVFDGSFDKERFKNRVYFTSDFISKYKISPQKPDSGKYIKTIDELLSIFKKDSLDNSTLINLIDWFIIANSQTILYDGSSTWSYTASKLKGTKRISFKDEF